MSSAARFVLLSLFVLVAHTCVAQDATKLVWRKDRPLKWSDFKGRVDTSAKYHAVSLCEVFANYKWTVKDNKYSLTFATGSYFNPSASWSAKAKQTPALLRHEQLHFDIAELFARVYLQRLNSQVYNASFKSVIEKINQDNLRKLKVMQDKYDEETEHAEDQYRQAQWEKYITKLLRTSGSIKPAMLIGPAK